MRWLERGDPGAIGDVAGHGDDAAGKTGGLGRERRERVGAARRGIDRETAPGEFERNRRARGRCSRPSPTPTPSAGRAR